MDVVTNYLFSNYTNLQNFTRVPYLYDFNICRIGEVLVLLAYKWEDSGCNPSWVKRHKKIVLLPADRAMA
ncbi:hypothetical protein PIB30_102761, partial [Stylosanthes scabra]|nr:hypothetical protein [Stylosanthes scabra]